MIQNPQVDGAGGFGKGTGQLFILRGWLGISAGVVMNQNDYCSA